MKLKNKFQASWLLISILALFITGCNSDGQNNHTYGDTEAEPAEREPANDSVVEGDGRPVRNSGKYFDHVDLKDETVIEFAVVLPDNYSADEIYPVLLAFPPGAQTEAMVEAGLGYWEQEAAERGWIVVSPVAPNHTLFFRGSEVFLPEFLSHIAAQFQPEGGKFHAAGISNGGISAFRLAVNSPELVHSILVLPGYPSGEDRENLAALQDIPIAMFVGGNDTAWVNQMETAEASLSELGASVTLEIVAGEGHVIRSLRAEVLFDVLDSFRSDD